MAAYRDTFCLLIGFAATHASCQPSKLDFVDLVAEPMPGEHGMREEFLGALDEHTSLAEQKYFDGTAFHRIRPSRPDTLHNRPVRTWAIRVRVRAEARFGSARSRTVGQATRKPARAPRVKRSSSPEK